MRRQAVVRFIAATAVAAALLAPGAMTAGTLEDVRARGFVRCGIVEESPGFSSIDANGERRGFLVDQCRAVSAAVFGRFSIEFVPVTPQTSFLSLQTQRIDILAAGANWTFIRDVTLGLDYAGVNLYHSQGFLVRRNSGARTIADLDGATICVTQGTTAEQNLADHFDARGIRYAAVTFARIDQAVRAYGADRCDALTTEQIPLAGHASTLADPRAHLILPEVISKEPTSLVVRQGDDRWRDVVLWSLNVPLAAEELGISQATVDVERRRSDDARVRRLLGVEGSLGESLTLSKDWAYDVIRLVGNYDEIWQRNFARWDLRRGVNALWRDGGLLSALPIR
jgi:general L-amino acid transport system substrate-binding protein